MQKKNTGKLQEINKKNRHLWHCTCKITIISVLNVMQTTDMTIWIISLNQLIDILCLFI